MTSSTVDIWTRLQQDFAKGHFGDLEDAEVRKIFFTRARTFDPSSLGLRGGAPVETDVIEDLLNAFYLEVLFGPPQQWAYIGTAAVSYNHWRNLVALQVVRFLARQSTPTELENLAGRLWKAIGTSPQFVLAGKDGAGRPTYRWTGAKRTDGYGKLLDELSLLPRVPFNPQAKKASIIWQKSEVTAASTLVGELGPDVVDFEFVGHALFEALASFADLSLRLVDEDVSTLDEEEPADLRLVPPQHVVPEQLLAIQTQLAEARRLVHDEEDFRRVAGNIMFGDPPSLSKRLARLRPGVVRRLEGLMVGLSEYQKFLLAGEIGVYMELLEEQS